MADLTLLERLLLRDGNKPNCFGYTVSTWLSIQVVDIELGQCRNLYKVIEKCSKDFLLYRYKIFHIIPAAHLTAHPQDSQPD